MLCIGISVYLTGLPTRTAVHIRLLGEVLRGHEGKWHMYIYIHACVLLYIHVSNLHHTML